MVGYIFTVVVGLVLIGTTIFLLMGRGANPIENKRQNDFNYIGYVNGRKKQ